MTYYGIIDESVNQPKSSEYDSSVRTYRFSNKVNFESVFIWNALRIDNLMKSDCWNKCDSFSSWIKAVWPISYRLLQLYEEVQTKISFSVIFRGIVSQLSENIDSPKNLYTLPFKLEISKLLLILYRLYINVKFSSPCGVFIIVNIFPIASTHVFLDLQMGFRIHFRNYNLKSSLLIGCK